MICFNGLPKSLTRPIVLSIVFFAITVLSAAAQKNAKTEAEAQKRVDAAAQKVKDAAEHGTPLTNTATTDVTGNTSVEATLIPASIARTVFGKEIANHYAVISLTISNQSSDYAFIVHTVFIDYSQWLLGGASPFIDPNGLCSQEQKTASLSALSKKSKSTNSSPGQGLDTSSGSDSSQQQPDEDTKVPSCPGNPLRTDQQQTSPNQLASVESRIVREELLIKQSWTTRNWVLRAMQAAGSIATGFTFATSSQSWIQGIGAFNGSVIPAYQTLFPDSTIGQMNQISNVGFQVNKAIAKQSSDIVVAFFPLDRFLTPDLQSLYLSSPSAFFSPVEALVDPKTRGKVSPYILQIFRSDNTWNALSDNMLKFLPQLGTDACENYKNSTLPLDQSALVTTPSHPNAPLEVACLTAAAVNRLSLNTIRVVVGGTMTIDVNSVPSQITSVDIDTPAVGAEGMWKKGSLNGTIHGSFLSGATPTLVSPPSGVTIKNVADGSTDTQLHFTLSLASDFPASTSKLTFQVTKSGTKGASITSSTYDYPVQIPAAEEAAPAGKGEKAPDNTPATSTPVEKTPHK